MSTSRLILSTLYLLFACQDLSAQQLPAGKPLNDMPIQSSYVELGGTGIAYSVNYDAIFSNGWGFRIGGGYIPEERRRSYDSGRDQYFGTEILSIILMGQYVTGNGPHKFELGAGVILGGNKFGRQLDRSSRTARPDPLLWISLAAGGAGKTDFESGLYARHFRQGGV